MRRKYNPRQQSVKIQRIQRLKSLQRATQRLLLLGIKDFSICNALWPSLPLKIPLSLWRIPLSQKKAIKIPSCHKKPLRRVDAGHLLADMKRIPALLLASASDCLSVCTGLSASLKRVRQNRPVDQEALNFYNLHFHLGSP